MSVQPAVPYPATLTIDYPDRKLDRLTSFFRLFTTIPIAIVYGLLNAGYRGGGGPFIFWSLLLMILFRKKYPKWWYDWNLEYTRFGARVSAYFLLMTDVYPSTDEEQEVHLNLIYPDAQKDLGRGMPIVKWFLAIPHYVVLAVLAIAAVVCAIIVWFAILFTGRYPKELFNFIMGVYRWGFRVAAYAFLLVTDRYPPFSLE
jgi:hypothetical protein